MTGSKLIGKSAGKICYSNLDPGDRTIASIVEGAEIMWESGRSAWSLVDETLDGGTIWISPGEDSYATVSPSGEIFFEVAE